ncbi:hypothetical protein JCM19240_6846 [Vibrio maritimus]|uniref:Ysc84 actin-binding domain-containing protein n=1 Tax=Vibrio maritimus TaxID=990268 RepID=A0A090TEC8_9VIBR|nr:hypothetical protein JCM19240_6846 [Vibrio maritimus]
MFQKSKRLRSPLLAILLAATSVLFSGSVYASDEKNSEKAQLLIEQASEKIDMFDSTEHWESVKNLTGVAKAILVFPSGGQAGFVLGAQWGKGILLTRNDHRWSEPVFVKFHSAMIGLLAGAQHISGVGVILSNDVLESLKSGPTKVGGTADLTVGKGVSGKVIGGTGGVSAMMVSENKGLYFGGSIDTFTLSLDKDLNQALYGDDFSLEAVLSNYDANRGKAQNLRNRLEGVAYRAVYH